MPITAQPLINAIRLINAVPNQNQGRWGDANIISFIDMAQKHLVQELLFPETRLTGFAITNQQAYAIPDSHRIYRVYLDGQIMVETPGGIDTLEGRQIGQYDTSGQGVSVTGSDAAQGGTTGQPQWTIMTPQVYPYLANLGSPSLINPAGVGMQGRFYRRTGAIGFVPAPANGAEITIDGVFVPPDVTQTSQTLEVPSYYQDAIIWYTTVMMKFADDTGSTQEQRNFAEQKYQEHLRKLRTTIRQYKMEDTTSIVRTDRWRYSFGRRLGGGYGGNGW